MEAGDPDLTELTEHAEGAGLVSAQAMVVSLTEAGRVARGEFVPSFESIEVDGDSATVEDCYRADLVEYDATTDEQVADRGGARFEATARSNATMRRVAGHRVRAGGRLRSGRDRRRGRDRYLAFWDAVWSAADPPDPDHPGLADTAAGDHLAGLQAQLTQLRDDGQVRRGRGTENPVVTYVTDHDTAALVSDCVEENPDGGVYDAQSGERIEGGTAPGQRTLLETRLELIDDAWRVVNVRVVEEDSSCVPDDPESDGRDGSHAVALAHRRGASRPATPPTGGSRPTTAARPSAPRRPSPPRSPVAPAEEGAPRRAPGRRSRPISSASRRS
jgi:hypothetical protein